MTPSRALITGGAGGIGLHVARVLLADGHDVTVVDDFSTGAWDEDFTQLVDTHGIGVHEADLTEADVRKLAAGAPQVVFHLAARVGVERTMEDPVGVLYDNVAMTVRALEVARLAGARRFVFASSSEVYAGALAAGTLPIPTPETAELVVPSLEDARAAYMLSKLCGESMTRQGGVPWTILRYHNVYGPRMGHKHVVPELTERALEAPIGGRLQVRSAIHRRTFCFVDDAAEFTVRAAIQGDCEHQVLNVGAAAPEITMRELAERIAGTVGKDLEVAEGPVDPTSPTRRRPDMTRAHRLTGHRAAVSLDEGLALTVDWYRRHHFSDA